MNSRGPSAPSGQDAKKDAAAKEGAPEKSLAQLRYNSKQYKQEWYELPMSQRVFFILDRGGMLDVDPPWIFAQLRSFVVRLNVVLTLLQTFAILLSYEPSYYNGGRSSTLVSINVVCTVFFTIDLIARIACVPPPKLDYALTPLNIVEFFGLVPFWIDLGSGVLIPGLSPFLLVLRVVRLIRWLLYLPMFEVISSTIEESTEIAVMFGLVAAIVLPVAGTMVYYAERGTKFANATGELWVRPCYVEDACAYQESPFQYASDGMWLAMTTVTTLGFGDLVPTSTLGKFITGGCMVIGVLVLSFPVMILSVNFGHEVERIRLRDLKSSGRRCAQLQRLQREYAKIIDFEDKKTRKSFAHRESIAFGDPTAMLLIPARAKPIYFEVPEVPGLRREAMLFTATEIRYDPLLCLKRDHRDVVALDQNRKRKTEFRFTLLLGTPEASKACQAAMTELLPEGSPRIARCRHFAVTRVNFGLEIPHDKGDFMQSIRLLRSYDDQIEQNRLQVDGTIELYALSNVDDGHVQEVAAALSRCRLHISASVVRSDPIHYEIPFFFGMLASTSLAHVISARKHKTGLIYCTQKQVVNLIYGVHQIFQLPISLLTDEEVHIVNLAEVNNTIANAILRQCAVEVDEPDVERMQQFLCPVYEEKDETGAKQQYYGLIPYKVTGRSEASAYLDAMFGFALGTKSIEEEEEARMSKMLCSVIVKGVRVRQMQHVEQF